MTTERPVARRRRRVVAPVGRIVVAGLSASATFGLVAVMGAVAGANTDTDLAPTDPALADPVAGAPAGSPTTVPTAPTTTRRKVYVIDHLPADAPVPGAATLAPDAPNPAPDGAPASAPLTTRPLARTRRS